MTDMPHALFAYTVMEELSRCVLCRDYHTIYKLVYHDLQGALQREAAAHLTAEGERAYAAFAAECPDGPPGIALKARQHHCAVNSYKPLSTQARSNSVCIACKASQPCGRQKVVHICSG